MICIQDPYLDWPEITPESDRRCGGVRGVVEIRERLLCVREREREAIERFVSCNL
jgi:hypothetical protein